MKNAKLVGFVALVLSGHWAVAQPSIAGINPASLSVSVGATVSFRLIAVSGASPFTYQWWFTNALGSSPIDGIENPSAVANPLTLTSVQMSAAGGYYAVVTDSNSLSATSRVAKLDVDPSFEQITAGDIVNTPSYSYNPCWGDYDGDGYLDLFVANGGNESPMQQFLYHNNRDGTFRRSTEADVGRLAGDKVKSAMGTWGDFDNDGNLDLFIGSQDSTNRLYHNLGNGTFAPVTSPGGTSYYATWGSAWADYDKDGWLDLYTTAYGSSDRIYHNERNGSFSWLKKFVTPTTSSLYPSWGDTDGDGDLDLYVGIQGGGGHYYRNDGGGVFTRMTGTNAVVGAGWYGTWGDYDNDGSLDLSAQNGLYHNDGHGWLSRVVGSPSGGQVSAWADYDNDGYLDLFFTQGQGSTNVLYRNNGDGSFTKVTRGSVVNIVANYTGCAWGDYDNDGFMDLFVCTVANQPNYLFRGRPNGNHWLSVKLRGTASNASAIGATVRAYASLAGRDLWQMRQIAGGTADDLRAHFGLRDATKVTMLRIDWPSGTVQEFANVAADQILSVWEPPVVSASLRADGACELTIKAEPNRAWQIQASGDLLTWQTLTTLTSATAVFQFTDTAAAGMACRFYRLESK